MPLKPTESIFEVDPRFATIGTLHPSGFAPLGLADHHAALERMELKGSAPKSVRRAFDRARNVALFAWFDYDLLVVAEGQALGAVELALMIRLGTAAGASRSGFAKLVEQARREGIIPAASSEPFVVDGVDMLQHLHNELAHGHDEIHSMAFEVLAASRNAIDGMFL